VGGQDIGQGWDYDYSVIGGQTLATLLLQLLDLFAYLDWCLETSYNAVDSQNRGDKLGFGCCLGLLFLYVCLFVCFGFDVGCGLLR